MKKSLFILIIIICIFASVPVWATDGLNETAAHYYYVGNDDQILAQYSKIDYLYDTLTLAGSGMPDVTTYTVLQLENLAFTTNLGYQNTYSLVTSGNDYTRPVMTGVKAYDFLVYAGMDKNLPDSTPVKFISKDGYAITLTLGQLRTGYSRYASLTAVTAEETNLPVLVSFGSNGLPLVGPTGTQAVYQEFTAADGYSQTADNIGGPLRLTLGQSFVGENNASYNSKWLAAIIIGNADGYVYSRETVAATTDDTVPNGGNWTHNQTGYNKYLSNTLVISGSEAKAAELTVADLESLNSYIVRQYFAASGGRNVYEGVVLRDLITDYLVDGMNTPSKITIVAQDGYAVTIDVNDIINGIESFYQPGKHRDIILAYAIDGVPLVTDDKDTLYNDSNAYGPLKLIVENTGSQWVKSVAQIIIGNSTFTDSKSVAVNRLYVKGIIGGYSDGSFRPGNSVSYGEALKMIMLAAGYQQQTAVKDGSWASGYLQQAIQAGLAVNKNIDLDQTISGDQANMLLAEFLGSTKTPFSQGNGTISRDQLAETINELI